MDGWKGETRGAKRVGSADLTTRLRCGLTVCGPTKALPAMPERESIRSCDGDGSGDGMVERRRRRAWQWWRLRCGGDGGGGAAMLRGRREADRGAAIGQERSAGDRHPESSCGCCFSQNTPLSLTLVGGQKYAFFGLPSLTLAGQNVLSPVNIREGAAVGCQT